MMVSLSRNQIHILFSCCAAKLVGSRQPVGHPGETPCVFSGFSIGDPLARSAGHRRSRLSINSQRLFAMVSRGLCGGCRVFEWGMGLLSCITTMKKTVARNMLLQQADFAEADDCAKRSSEGVAAGG